MSKGRVTLGIVAIVVVIFCVLAGMAHVQHNQWLEEDEIEWTHCVPTSEIIDIDYQSTTSSCLSINVDGHGSLTNGSGSMTGIIIDMDDPPTP